MPHWPGKRFLGPGTEDLNAEPVDFTDYIAKLHDIAYSRATSESDIYKADHEAIRDFLDNFAENPTEIASLVGASGLSLKNFVEETVLGRVLYGINQQNTDDASNVEMSKRPHGNTLDKHWGKIKNINRHRATNRAALEALDRAEREDAANRNVDAEDAGPSGVQGSDNVLESPSLSGSYLTAMDDPMGDGSARAGGGAGGAGASGGMGSGSSAIYRGTPQEPNYSTLHFNKSYHFSLSNGLPEFRRTSTNEYGLANQLRLNSIHCLPWERLAFYCSEGEIYRLVQNYSFAEVESVQVDVYSLGVRLPFVTGQTTSLIANSMAQIPIGKYDFDKDVFTHYENGDAIISSCWGTEWKTNQGTSTTWSADFANLTASTGNRVLNNPVIVNYPISMAEPNEHMFPKDIGIYDYVDIKNGNTVYGPAWSMTHKPTRGVFNAKSLETNAVNPLDENANFTLLNGGQFWQFGQGVQTANYNGNIAGAYSNFLNNRNVIIRNININPTQMQVDNNTLFAAGDSCTQSKAMPKFMIGVVNIRNLAEGSTNATILECRWDIMVKASIKIKVGDNVTRGYINRVRQNVPFAYSPYTFLTNTGVQQVHPNPSAATSLYNKRLCRLAPATIINITQVEIGRAKIKSGTSLEQVIAPYQKELQYAQKHHVHNPDYVQSLKILAHPDSYNSTISLDVIQNKFEAINNPIKQ